MASTPKPTTLTLGHTKAMTSMPRYVKPKGLPLALSGGATLPAPLTSSIGLANRTANRPTNTLAKHRGNAATESCTEGQWLTGVHRPDAEGPGQGRTIDIASGTVCTWRPLRDSAHQLPRFTPNSARLSRLLCDARVPATLAQDFGISQWRLVLNGSNANAADTNGTAGSPRSGTQAPSWVWIALQHERGTARIGVDPHLYPALASAATIAQPTMPPASRHDVTPEQHWQTGTSTASFIGMPDALRHTVTAMILAPLLDAFGQLGLEDLIVNDIRHGTSATTVDRQNLARLHLHFTLDDHHHKGVIDHIPSRWLERLEHRFSQQRIPFGGVISALRIPGYLVLGARTLSVRQLNALRPGDIVLRAVQQSLTPWFRAQSTQWRNDDTAVDAKHATPHRDIAARIEWGVPGARQWVTPILLSGTRITLNQDPFMPSHPSSRDVTERDETLGHKGSNAYQASRADDLARLNNLDEAGDGDWKDPLEDRDMTDEPTCEDGAQEQDAVRQEHATKSLDDLDLPIRFEIETVTLPLVQLSALRSGYVLELPTTLADARVRMVSYGQVIGTGELVTIGEHLGVRVLDIANGHDPVQ